LAELPEMVLLLIVTLPPDWFIMPAPMPPPIAPAELPEMVLALIVTVPVPLRIPPPYPAELPEMVLSPIVSVPPL